MATADRRRYPRPRTGIKAPMPGQYNPMPTLPWVDAMMWIALTQRGIPFYYRWFSGVSAMLRGLMPDWAPEFTIPARKTVIVILGNFSGNIPSVIDQTSLAKAVLEQEGWKFYIVHENDLRNRGFDAVVGTFRNLIGLHAAPLKQPFGLPDVMAPFRRMRETSRRYISTNARVRSRSTRGRVRRPSYDRGYLVGRDYRRPERERRPGGRRRRSR